MTETTVKFMFGRKATGEQIMLFDQPQGDLIKQPMLNPFFFGGKEVNILHFYDEDGVVVSSRWLDKGISSNNPFDNVKFVDGIKNRKAVRFDRNEVFRVASTKRSTWSGGNYAIDVYVPMQALDACGWAQLETTTEGQYETHKEQTMYVGGECTKKDHLFKIHISSNRVKHWDKKKALLMQLLQEAETEEEFLDSSRTHLPLVR